MSSASASSNDDFVKRLTTQKDAYSDKKNKFLNVITFVGPFPSKVEKASRKKILICDPKTGRGVRGEDRLARWRAARTAVR